MRTATSVGNVPLPIQAICIKLGKVDPFGQFLSVYFHFFFVVLLM